MNYLCNAVHHLCPTEHAVSSNNESYLKASDIVVTTCEGEEYIAWVVQLFLPVLWVDYVDLTQPFPRNHHESDGSHQTLATQVYVLQVSPVQCISH
jgi:hypothetical protein